MGSEAVFPAEVDIIRGFSVLDCDCDCSVDAQQPIPLNTFQISELLRGSLAPRAADVCLYARAIIKKLQGILVASCYTNERDKHLPYSRSEVAKIHLDGLMWNTPPKISAGPKAPKLRIILGRE